MSHLGLVSKAAPAQTPSNSHSSNRSMESEQSSAVSTIAETSPFLRLPAEIRHIIYGYVLQGTEQPLFFIENNEIWRCGPSSAFMRPGPPSLLRVSRSVAAGASHMLHEVRELRLAIISQGFPTGKVDCYHRFGRLENFQSVLERIQTLTLVIHAHPGHRIDEPYLVLLDWICSLLEKRDVPIRQLGLVLTCCYSDRRRLCKEDKFDLARRFQELQPTFVEHSPWNGRCMWSKVKQTKGRYRKAVVPCEGRVLVDSVDGYGNLDGSVTALAPPQRGSSLEELYARALRQEIDLREDD